jgi:hypothetical protein
MTEWVSSHVRIDHRSLDLHRLIADKIRMQPDLFALPIANIRRWKAKYAVAPPCFDEWAEILEKGMDHALAVATEDSDRAAELRQCSPFTGILSPQERWRFLKQWNEANPKV